MIILIDTREQKPLDFTPYKTERVTLQVGDYGCRFEKKLADYEPPVYFERKSLGDLWGTLATKEGHRRFRNKITLANELNYSLMLLIEGTFSKIEMGYSYRKQGEVVESKFSGDSMTTLLATMTWRHKLVSHYFTRKEMSRWIVKQFSAIGKERLKQVKQQL